MRSVKMGRGPSFMGGIGALGAAAFGLIWTFATVTMGAPFFFPLFGLVFVFMGAAQAVYNFKNAAGKNRYSSFDITEGDEEPDPLNERFGGSHDDTAPQHGVEFRFCPYCGNKLEGEYKFCPGCGKEIKD